MANKVLSIKMDEKDIERIRKYYELLVKSGFLSSKTTTLNAFYKHLLLDYLEMDVSRVFRTFSEHGIMPRYINPDEMNNNDSFTIVNTYDLDMQMFELYKACVKESLSRSIEEMNANAEAFNKLTNAEIVVTGGWMHEMEYIDCYNREEQEVSFWEKKAYEIMDLHELALRENDIAGDIIMIEKSSLSDGLKYKLIDEIKEYEKRRRQNYKITKGLPM